MNTFMANAQNVERKWYVVDAEGKTLGRLASEVAKVLRGKNKPEYTPHVDTGDYVIIINADKAILTGRKLDQKIYYHHSGYTGGMSETKYRDLMNDKPELPCVMPSLVCCPRAPWVVRWRRSCSSMRARIIRMPRRSPKRSN